MSASHKIRAVWVVSAVIGMLLAAVAYVSIGSASADGGRQAKATQDEFLTADQVSQGLDLAVRGFDGEMPSGYKTYLALTERRLSEVPSGANGESFEPGFSESLILDIWRCAWEGQFLQSSKSGEVAAAQEATDQLGKYYDLNYALQYFDDPSREWQKAVLEPAVRGESAAMEADFSACNGGGSE